MQTKSYTTIDKSDWPRGEWDDEPDKMQWQDEETGLPCLIVRGPSGALCGYVGVSEGHPAFGKDYDLVHRMNDAIDVHGGLTFAGHCQTSDDESWGICHVPEPGELDRVWWLGFDCAHVWDRTPAYERHIGPRSDVVVYRNFAYVQGHVRNLAAQLKAMAAA